MQKVVLDTNIFISAIHFGGPPAEILKLAAESRILIFVSREIITEIIGVLRKKFDYKKEILEEIEELLKETCELVEPRCTIKVIKNQPSDNRILECALAAKVTYLISGDKRHILPLKKFKGIKIISAKDFLNIFRYGSA